MRLLLLAVAVSLAATATARADDDDDDEDGEFVGFPKRSIAVTGVGHGSYIGGVSESGFGVGLELAVGRGRWQYFGESTLASTGYSSWTTGIDEMPVEGRMIHGGAGIRWLARQFRPDSGGGFELFLVSALGLQRFYFEDGGRLTRPELALGTGFQVRLYKRPKLAIRVDIRVAFTPDADENALVACRGRCDMDAGTNTGFTTSFGIAW